MNDLLARCTAFLLERRHDVYLVGGTVRDLELGRESHDIDLAAPRAALQIARQLADHFGGAYYPLDAERETGRVILADHAVIDVALLRGPDIYADLAARDFTVNAMARHLNDPATLIDPHGGLHDLDVHALRAVSDHIFADDPARLLRACRLAAELGLEVEPATAAFVERDANMVATVAGERVRDELLRIFQRGDAVLSARALVRYGLLARLLPHAGADPARLEVVQRLGTPAEPAPKELDVGARIVAEFSALFASDLVASPDGGQTNAVIIKLAALYDQPAGIVSDLGQLRFRRDEVQYARTLVAERGRLRELSLPVTALDAHRFFRDSGAGAGHMGLLLLALAEATPATAAERAEVVRQLLLYYRDRYGEVIAPKPLLNGAELAARFGLKGRQIGEALRLLVEAQVQGSILTVAEAEGYVRQSTAMPRTDPTTPQT